MTLLVYILLFLILVLFVIALPLFLILAIESLVWGHDLPTSRRGTRALAKTIQKYKPNAKTFYDLGCAHGILSLRMKRILPHLEIQAIDNSAVRIFFAKLKSKILGCRIHFQKQDIFKTDLRNADVIYTYLWYDLMPILEKKLQKELRQGTVVITNTSHFQNWQPIEEVITYPNVSKSPNFETLFVYIKE
jgi:SAM-dependent methyltransferase|tara:strand:- start:4353 stop:4922 length:570 start_codon:yes stop_codon:yes gene_type:complete